MNTWDSLSQVVKDRTTGDVTSTDTRPVRDVYAQGMMAPQYSALTFPVAAGAHCIYEGELYAAKQDIAASEAWTAAHWDKVQLGAEVAKVGASVADLKSQMNNFGRGTTWQILRKKSNTNYDVEWTDVGSPTDTQVEAAVDTWLEEHPEATTTVQDESLTVKKLVIGTLGFVTPEMYGAKGDGETNDTNAIVNAISSGKQVNLSYGKTYIMTLAEVPHGFILNGNGATIKRPNLKNPPYNRSDAQIRGEAIIRFSTVNLGMQTIIRDVVFDGNAFSMWQPSDGNKYEQAPLIAIGGTSDIQAKILIENCSFNNNYASGISAQNYVDAKLLNSFVSNCYKSAMTCVGYGSNYIIENLTHHNTSEDYRWGTLHTEINSSDFENDPQSNYTLRGLFGEVGGLFGGMTGKGIINIDSINISNIGASTDNGASQIYIDASNGGKTNVSNTTFKFAQDAVSSIALRGSGNFSFNIENAVFDGTIAGNCHVSFIPMGNNPSGTVRFTNCTFIGLKYGVWIARNDSNCAVNLVFDKCKFSDIKNIAVGSGDVSVLKAASITFNDCVFQLNQDAYIYKQDGTEVNQPVLRFSGNRIVGQNAGLRLYGLAGDTLIFDNELWDEGCGVSYYRSSRNPCVFGMRYRLLSEAPTGIAFNDHDIAIVTDQSTGTRTTYLYTGNQWVLQS